MLGDQGQSAIERIRQGLDLVRIGRHIVWLNETSSTNSTALDMVAGGVVPQIKGTVSPDGLVVLANYQTAGRGRQGRSWHAPRGASVLCSVVIVEREESVTADACDGARLISGRLNMVAAVAACEAIAEATEVRPGIKWPNDLLVLGKKLGGILIESRSLGSGQVGIEGRAAESKRAWVLGFGINCLQHVGHFPPELVGSATSLELAASHAVSRLAVVRALLARLDHWLGHSDWRSDSRLAQRWSQMAEPLGRRLRLRYQGQEYSGRTMEVDPVGGLTMQLDNGRPMWFDPLLTSVLP